eukprot:492798_1
MGCVAGKILGYCITVANSGILVAYFLSIGMFTSASDIHPAYIAIILVLAPLICFCYGYLLAYISWRKEDIGRDKGALQTKYIVLTQLMMCLSTGMALLRLIIISVSDQLITSFSMDDETFFTTMAYIGFFYPFILLMLGYFVLMPYEKDRQEVSEKEQDDTEKQDLKQNIETHKIEIIDTEN